MTPEQVFLCDREEILGSAELLLSHETGFPNEVIHGHHLREFAREDEHLVAVYNVQLFQEYVERSYPYNYRGFEDPPNVLGDMNKVEKVFKNVIAWDVNKTVENQSSFAPFLRSLPQKVSVTCLDNYGISKYNLTRSHKTNREDSANISVHGTDTVYHEKGSKDQSPNVVPQDDKMNASAHETDTVSHETKDVNHGVGSDNDVIDLTGAEMDSDDALKDAIADEMDSGNDEMDSIDHELDLAAHEMDFSDGDILDCHDHELNSDAHGMDPTSLMQPDTATDIESSEESSSRRSPLPNSNRKTSPRPPHLHLGYDSAIKKRTYRYNKRIKACEKAVSKLQQKRERMYRISFERNPFETLRDCCNAACFVSVNPEYAIIQYRRFLKMSRCAKKRALKAMHDQTLEEFRFDGQRVCSQFLSKGFNFCFCLQGSVKGTPKARASASIKACPREIKSDTKKDDIIQFLKKLADNIGDSMPTRNHTNLPLMDKTQVYQRFVEQCGRAEPSSKSYFHRVWKKYCQYIKAHRHHGFTVCDICEVLRSELSTCADEEMQGILRAKMNVHYKHMQEERRGYAARRDMSTRSPSKYCSIIVDGADQTCYGLPHFVFKTKGEQGHKLKVRCVGVLEHGNQKHLSLFTLTEEFESGANHVVEAVHHVLEEKKLKGGVLPEVLFMQADNCTRENKNRYFMAYFEMLVALGVFKEVQISFLPIGHTHADIDQAFSSVARRLRMNNAVHMESLLQELQNCYNPRATAEEMTSVANFSGLCESSGCLIKVSSFSQYRYFRFTRRGDRAPRSSRESDSVFQTTSDVKFQNCEEWAPMDNSETRKGFFKFVPNLSDTPPTDTTPPDNVLEINKHLRSVEARLKTGENLRILESMRDRVYTRRVVDFHWNFERAFEMNGDYKGDGNGDNNGTEAHDLEASKLLYNLNWFLAVKTDDDCSDPFWIARTLCVEEANEPGNAEELKVRWYQAKEGGQDVFSAAYEMSTYFESTNRILFDDVIDVRTILCEFDALTKGVRLYVRTQKAIRQTLNMN